MLKDKSKIFLIPYRFIVGNPRILTSSRKAEPSTNDFFVLPFAART